MNFNLEKPINSAAGAARQCSLHKANPKEKYKIIGSGSALAFKTLRELQGTKFVQLQCSVLVAVGAFVFKVLHVMRPFIRHKRTSAADKWMSLNSRSS